MNPSWKLLTSWSNCLNKLILIRIYIFTCLKTYEKIEKSLTKNFFFVFVFCFVFCLFFCFVFCLFQFSFFLFIFFNFLLFLEGWKCFLSWGGGYFKFFLNFSGYEVESTQTEKLVYIEIMANKQIDGRRFNVEWWPPYTDITNSIVEYLNGFVE